MRPNNWQESHQLNYFYGALYISSVMQPETHTRQNVYMFCLCVYIKTDPLDTFLPDCSRILSLLSDRPCRQKEFTGIGGRICNLIFACVIKIGALCQTKTHLFENWGLSIPWGLAGLETLTSKMTEDAIFKPAWNFIPMLQAYSSFQRGKMGGWDIPV